MAEATRTSVERDHPTKTGDEAKGHNFGSAGTTTRRSSGSGFQDTDAPATASGHNKLRPHYRDKFNINKVERVLQATIQEYMKNRKYSSADAEGWTSELSSILNTLVKQFNFPRYKLVSIVTIGENVGGGVHMGLKTLWDADTDLFATYTYMTDTFFVVGVVCGVYYYC